MVDQHVATDEEEEREPRICSVEHILDVSRHLVIRCVTEPREDTEKGKGSYQRGNHADDRILVRCHEHLDVDDPDDRQENEVAVVLKTAYFAAFC